MNYTKWIHWCITNRCNLNCSYCFINHDNDKREDIESIDINSLMNTLDKTGEVFKISFTGNGEPFLIPNFAEACIEISKKHYLAFNTNLTQDSVKRLFGSITPDRVDFIHASLHIKELEHRGLLNRFIENFKFCRDLGFNIYAEEVAHPSLFNEVDKYRDLFRKEHGIELKFGTYYGKFEGRTFPSDYTKEELEKFDISLDDENKFYQQGNICNAGFNAAVAFSRGNIKPCFQIKDDMGNLYKEIRFSDKTIKCRFKKCGCPLNYYDKKLYDLSIKKGSH